MIAEAEYLNHIQRIFPDFDLSDVQINQEGMVNVSVIVNWERVFRFPRKEWGVALQRNEMNALDLVRQYVDIPVPTWDYRSDEMISYPYIPGDPLLTDDVLRMSELEKDAVADMLATFLKQMHLIPMAAVEAADIQPSATVRTVEERLQFYEDVQTHLFPLMWADGREWARCRFAPFLTDHAFLDYEPAFMNGNLGVYHLLFDRQTNRFNGIIDFGTAGIGDPALDFGIIIKQYGESFLRRMSQTYPEIREHIDRARFFADGNYMESINIGASTASHGVWMGAGNTYLYSFHVFSFDEEGEYAGRRIVRVKIQMDGPDHHTGSGAADIITPDGEVIKNAFSVTTKGTRMEVELQQ